MNSMITSFTRAAKTIGFGFLLTTMLCQTSNAQSVKRPIPLENQRLLTFGLNWTQCFIHRYNSVNPVDIILEGVVASTDPICWVLLPTNPTQSLAMLQMVNDVQGNSSSAATANIPVSYQISINGGPYTPLSIEADGNIYINFTEANCVFQLRIQGVLETMQDDGHYVLALAQDIVPIL